VLHVVLFALSCTRVAGGDTAARKVVHELRALTDESNGDPTHLGALPIEANAVRHFVGVWFTDASVETTIAFLHTADTSLDTGLSMLMCHGELRNKFSNRRWRRPVSMRELVQFVRQGIEFQWRMAAVFVRP
jgi:hypothetical protein